MSKNKQIYKNVAIPDTFKDLDKWESNRRSFLRAALVAGAATQLAWFTSCSKVLEDSNEYLSAEESTILKSILNTIWPDDGNGPGIDELNTFGYVLWVFSDQYTEQSDKDYLIEGLNWADEQALHIYEQHFYDLSSDQQEILIYQFLEMDWGKNWMYVMQTYVLESLILDPIYGGNKDESGWKWLDHVTGLPRPTEETRMESIIAKYKSNV
ncbi:gluconate 2-dehydrogenase subunit 3 family protein [Paracrocinitomix mangrovi]|uniref:gluconate 2-dehydrogenase subunit 3 family protein n=1 Tax=Paracrocinitomix mangrovi TaxID=2862509 RepID=UPI001C8D304C|nr:gluconate 2-dehydrogenase subunit 3 family protein [Paracrocinitomix mangrovi]UKN03071.1 gluconate 2-dehydrogenase subunit 3 family protein [Paracrocinitomix mangrovi]